MSEANPYAAGRVDDAEPASRGPVRPILVAAAGALDVLGRRAVHAGFLAALDREWLALPELPAAFGGQDVELAFAAIGLPVTIAAAALAARLAPARPGLHATLAVAWPALGIGLAAVLAPGPALVHPAYVIAGLAAVAPAAFLGTLLGARRGRR